MRYVPLATLPLLLVSLPAAAAPASADDQAAWSKKDQVVCRNGATPGTRMGRVKVCMTASEWREQKKLARNAIEGKQRDQLLINPLED